MDLPNLAPFYIRQNNDLKTTLRRFEQDKQKQMKSIEDDIWELQKFMQGLKCVTAMSAEDIKPFRQRKPKERRVNTKTLSVKYLQTEEETSLNNESLPSTAPIVSVTDQTVGNDQRKNEEPLPDNLNQERNTLWRMHQRRRSSSVGESSATREHLKTIASYNQPLFCRRKSLVTGKHMQPSLFRRNSLEVRNQPLLQQRRSLIARREPCFRHRKKSLDLVTEATKILSCERSPQSAAEPYGRENLQVEVADLNEQPTTTENLTNSNTDKSFNLKNGKLNALQSEDSCRKLSVLYQRPPSTVIEEAIVEADEVETFRVPGQSKTTSPSPNVVEIPKRKEDGRILVRRNTCKLVVRPSSLATRQLDSSNMTEKSIKRNFFSGKTETQGCKETTSSGLRKQSSRDTAIGYWSIIE